MNRHTYIQAIPGSPSSNTGMLAVAGVSGCVLLFVARLMEDLSALRWGVFPPSGGSDRFSMPFFAAALMTVTSLGAVVVWALASRVSFRFAFSAPALGLSFLAAAFHVASLCVDNTRSAFNVPDISVVLLGALCPLFAAVFSRVLAGRDGRRWCHAATFFAVFLSVSACIVQYIEPYLTQRQPAFTASGAGWSVYYFFAIVFGTALHFACTTAFMSRLAVSDPNESFHPESPTASLLPSSQSPDRHRTVSAVLMFLLMFNVFSTGFLALGPLYDAIPRVGEPTYSWTGLNPTAEASINVRDSYRRFASGFTNCVFVHRGEFHCDAWQKYVAVSVVCHVGATIGVALGTLFGPLCPLIALLAGSTARRIVVAQQPEWSPLILLKMTEWQYVEAGVTLFLFVTAFLLWFVWEYRSRNEAALGRTDATAYFYPERASYQPDFQSGPLTYHPVSNSDGYGASKAAV